MTNSIRGRIASFTATQSVVESRVSPTNRGVAAVTLAQMISAKLEEGNIRAALRLLSSDDTIAVQSDETLASLIAKHPPASQPVTGLVNIQIDSLAVDQNAVHKAVMSFPPGSAGGPDGLRPQQLKELVQCREAGAVLLAALTDFVNMTLAGRCPETVAQVFFGGRLIALSKKSGGIRPIAIGMTLRRIVSKCASTYGSDQLASYFCPRQLGVGTSGGCEAAVHAARRFLQTMTEDHAVVKLDFSNAFNSLHRPNMLQAVKDRIPALLSYCCSSYVRPSKLFYGSHTIWSQEGPQQGDPLGPLLFSNTLQPLLLSLSSHLTLGFLDDLTLGGPIDMVAADVQTVIKEGEAMGLRLNCSKCELVVKRRTLVTDPTLLSFRSVNVNDAELLGAPLFEGQVLNDAWASRCAELATGAKRLEQIDSQDALILLRSSFSAPRVQHLLRCSPSVDNPALVEFDKQLRAAVSRLTNCDLSDEQWLQATLPVRLGGLGIRRVSSLALPAFLASAASTLQLQTTILAQTSSSAEDSTFTVYLEQWKSTSDTEPPSDVLPAKQSF